MTGVALKRAVGMSLYEQMYEEVQRMESIFTSFAILAIIVACLGLFGLAAFTAERRRKEIGIRKALGQSSKQITVLFSGEFAKLISVSILFGLPLGYILINNWLSGFAYRINLHYGYFLLAGVTALAVTHPPCSMHCPVLALPPGSP